MTGLTLSGPTYRPERPKGGKDGVKRPEELEVRARGPLYFLYIIKYSVLFVFCLKLPNEVVPSETREII